MRNAISMNELEQVRGATWLPNYFTDEEYRKCGIQPEYRIILPDRFTLPNGQVTGVSEANGYIKEHFPEVYEARHAANLQKSRSGKR